ncbi:retrotransposon protein, putative, ty1-copia subclass [Tanacetum coccineum]
MAARGNNKGKGKSKLAYAPKPKIPPPPKKEDPAKDSIFHHCGDTCHWKRNCPQYLSELLKNTKLTQGASTSGIFTIELFTFPGKSWVYDTGCGTHICNTTQGFRRSWKLKPGALSMYMGNGQRAAVEAIGSYDLFSCLYDDGFINRFENDNPYSVSKDNLIYFNVVPMDGIFEIVLSDSNTNVSFMYAVSNKRAKINLDSSLLWHCRLGHISKKRIKKLQHDELLNSIDSKIVSRQGASYFVTFTDDFSRYGYVYLLKHKHEVFETFKVFQKEVENYLGKTIKLLCSDRGGEYIEFLDHLKEHGTIAHRTPPYMPQHNGVSERRNRTLLDMVRSMMSQTTLPKFFWDYALESAARILNMVPTKEVEKTPYEVWYGQAAKLVLNLKRYPKEIMGYSFYYPPENKVFVDRNAKFFENSLITQEASGSLEDLEIIQEEDTHPSENTSSHHDEGDQEIDEPQSDIIPIRRSTRTRNAPDQMCLNIEADKYELGDLNKPANYKAALLFPESDKWLNAINVELQSMKDNEKTDMDEAGYTKTPEIDYEETFSPVADIRAIRILIAIAVFYDSCDLANGCYKTAFIKGYSLKRIHGETYWVLLIKISKRVCKIKGPLKSYLEGVLLMTDLGEAALYSWNKRSTEIDQISERMQNVPYASAVGSIMYDVRCTRPDVAFAHNITIRFQHNLEAEYIAASDASKEAVWVRKFIVGLAVVPTIEEPIKMYCDNT